MNGFVRWLIDYARVHYGTDDRDLERSAAKIFDLARPIFRDCTDDVLYYCITRGIDRSDVSSLYRLLRSIERLLGSKSDLLLGAVDRTCLPATTGVRERDLLTRVYGEVILGLVSGSIRPELGVVLDFISRHTGDPQ